MIATHLLRRYAAQEVHTLRLAARADLMVAAATVLPRRRWVVPRQLLSTMDLMGRFRFVPLWTGGPGWERFR